MFDCPPSVTTIILITISIIVLQVPSMYLKNIQKWCTSSSCCCLAIIVILLLLLLHYCRRYYVVVIVTLLMLFFS